MKCCFPLVQDALALVRGLAQFRLSLVHVAVIGRRVSPHQITRTTGLFAEVWSWHVRRSFARYIVSLSKTVFLNNEQLRVRFVSILRDHGPERVDRLHRLVVGTRVYLLLQHLRVIIGASGPRCLHRVLRVSHIVFVALLVNDTVQLPCLVQNGLSVRFGAQFKTEEVLTLLQIYIVLNLLLQLLKRYFNKLISRFQSQLLDMRLFSKY